MADLPGRTLEEQLAEIPRLDASVLGAAWAELFGRPPPKCLSRRLLEHAAAYQAQAKLYDGLAKATRRKLTGVAQKQAAAVDGTPHRKRRGALAPGSPLVREWQGRCHTVEVTEQGFLYAGRRYRSLFAVLQRAALRRSFRRCRTACLGVDAIIIELEEGRRRGRPDADLLNELVVAKRIEMVTLGNPAAAIFEELVIGPAAMTLDDGEAATIAYAVEQGAITIIDERKANRICGARFPKLRVGSTVDLFAHPAVMDSLGREPFRGSGERASVGTDEGAASPRRVGGRPYRTGASADMQEPPAECAFDVPPVAGNQTLMRTAGW